MAQWQPRNVGPMVDLVDCWAPVLPLWILDYVLEQLIFPRLQKEVTYIYILILFSTVMGKIVNNFVLHDNEISSFKYTVFELKI